MLISSVRSALRCIPLIILPALPLLLSSCSDGVNDVTINDTYFVIDRVVPRAAHPGEYVVIYIHAATADTSQFQVEVAGTPAKILSLKPWELIIEVPQQARGNDIVVTQKGRSSMVSRSVTAQFQVIDSPYRFNGYEVDIDGITGISAHSYSSDAGSASTWSDTSELDISSRQIDILGPDGAYCDEYTNGDTIRICSNTTSSGGRGYNRFTVVAIVDAHRGVISRMEINQAWSSADYTSPLEQESETGGARMIFRDIPYTTLDNGDFRADIAGSDILDHIVLYEFSNAENAINGDRWSTGTRAVHTLTAASDQALFTIRLFNTP